VGRLERKARITVAPAPPQLSRSTGAEGAADRRSQCDGTGAVATMQASGKTCKSRLHSHASPKGVRENQSQPRPLERGPRRAVNLDRRGRVGGRAGWPGSGRRDRFGRRRASLRPAACARRVRREPWWPGALRAFDETQDGGGHASPDRRIEPSKILLGRARNEELGRLAQTPRSRRASENGRT
jgi:hypothetical protein